MSTVTVERPVAAASPISRVTRVIKLHLVNPWTILIMPWIVIAAIFVLSYAIWLIIYASVDDADKANVGDGLQYSGASTWIFVYMFVVAVQAITLTFPLALGYGSTRRNFSIGTALTFVLLSITWSVGLTIVSGLETATHGWGIGGRMFTAIYFGGDATPLLERAVIFFCLTLCFYFVGSVGAAVWVRWRATGLTLFFFVLGVLIVGGIALLTLTDAWPAVGTFIETFGAFGIALWLLVPAVVSALAGYLVLRRATPRS
jgi:hypothetical protein